MTEALLLAELGPNPAALTEALWALPRLHATRVSEAFVLTSRVGYAWFEREILASSVYEQLIGCLGEAVPALEGVHLRVVACDDELSPADGDAWNEARWANATAALRAAGDRPVVFALAGGRQRSSAALTTVMFQLLARPQDRLVDVRVGDRRVEGARAGFFFPEQARQLLVVDDESLLAREVPVHLVEIRVPRLRRLLAEGELNTWSDALAAGQRAIEEVPRVEVELDLIRQSVVVNGQTVSFQQAEFIWFTTLALARLEPAHDGWVYSSDGTRLRSAIDALVEHDPRWTPQSSALSYLWKGGNNRGNYDAAMRKIRSSTAKRWREFLEPLGLGVFALRPEAVTDPSSKKRVIRWRLPVDSSSIRKSARER